MEGLSRRIRERRVALKVSQAELAKMMGGDASSKQISHYECDFRTPSVAALRALCIALKCSADYLLGLKEKP